ncbi:hypothetical protein MKZ38_005350 [Zalerion maritima]|uniref:Uncharacterized protein n=1 Tax=Zalerion maritima TaxID=339359 RepID=A0AAD5WX70_9PEZI|nr:hypothetical protein MKZ38_005350 [Zalerion maritima]
MLFQAELRDDDILLGLLNSQWQIIGLLTTRAWHGESASLARASAGVAVPAIWTGTTPPKGPARAGFSHRTRQTFSLLVGDGASALLVSRNSGVGGRILASSVAVDHALVGAGAIAVNLVEGHLNFASLGDLWKHVSGLGHNRLGAGFEVVVAGAEGLAEGVGIDAKSHALTTGMTGGLDGTVASNELGGSQEGGSKDSPEGGHCDCGG